MPKHGWKYRTERAKTLSPEALLERLHPHRHVSARYARWVYENLADREELRMRCLDCIGWDENVHWSHDYLWRELETHKAEEIGDWIVVALARPGAEDSRDAERFKDLYEDPSAHLKTRGSAIFAINNCLMLASFSHPPSRAYPLPESTWQRARRICADAARNEANPYARAGACWLAHRLGGFEEDLARLAQDHTVVEGCLTVSSHILD